MKSRYFLFVILALAATLGIYFTFFKHQESGSKIGAIAPDFSLTNASGETVSLSGLRGRPVLLNFWATWCGPCQEEMPSLEALYQRYKDRGLVIVGVSLDEEGWPAVQEFVKRVPVTFPIWLDATQKVSDLYQIYRVPETYLLDLQGKIVDKFVGPQNYDQDLFYKKIERQLK